MDHDQSDIAPEYSQGRQQRAVQVKSVSFFTRASGLSDLAQVRYLKAARQGPDAEETFTHWVATIQYAYAEAGEGSEDAPLESAGFQDPRFPYGARSAQRAPADEGRTTFLGSSAVLPR